MFLKDSNSVCVIVSDQETYDDHTFCIPISGKEAKKLRQGIDLSSLFSILAGTKGIDGAEVSVGDAITLTIRRQLP